LVYADAEYFLTHLRDLASFPPQLNTALAWVSILEKPAKEDWKENPAENIQSNTGAINTDVEHVLLITEQPYE